jgi:hypothetical protein
MRLFDELIIKYFNTNFVIDFQLKFYFLRYLYPFSSFNTILDLNLIWLDANLVTFDHVYNQLSLRSYSYLEHESYQNQQLLIFLYV